MNTFPNLFSPIQIANHTYKNRILAAPMLATYKAIIYGEVSDELLSVFESRAKGGCAEVVVGETPVNGTDAPPDGILSDEDVDYTKRAGRTFDAFRKYVDVIKKHNAIALIQLQHAGNVRNPLPFGKPNPLGPVGYVREDGVVVEAFNHQTMKKVRDDYVKCALYMQSAGFDGVLIHGAHGFLFTQFLSPAINQRTDEYGGTLENRGRFPREILGDIRKTLGPDFIIELRINGSDRIEGGSTNEHMAEFCSTLDGLVDIIHVSTGFKNIFSTQTFSSVYAPHGLNVDFAANIKKKTRIPVTVVGGINRPELAERIISEGKADFVSLARQMYADPEFENKTESFRAGEIRACIRCFRCLSGPPRISREKDTEQKSPGQPELPPENFKCTVNPELGKVKEISNLPKPENSRKVLVLGGGPAGMQAAITAFDRGHKVTLVEKDNSLGGVLNFTDSDLYKEDLKRFKDLLVKEVGRRGIQLLCYTKATPGFIQDFDPEVLILAIGATPTIPSIPGINNAIHALEVYKNNVELGPRAIMVGGGIAGCETALHLAKKGLEVTIVEMQNELVSDETGMARVATLYQIEITKNIIVRIGAKCVEIFPKSVKINCTSGEGETIFGDTIVYSLGMSARRAETENLRAAAGKAVVFEVGDCIRGAKVLEAISEGFMSAMKIV